MLGVSVEIDRYASIWSSDLERAIMTARLAGWDATSDPRLREIDFGELEGLQWDALSLADRESLAGFDGFQAPGGESTAQLSQRIVGFLDALGPGWHLAVTHGGVIRALLRMCGATDGFPQNGTIYDIDWTSRTVVRVQAPTV
jgi:probable phosphoglycerate mutase